MPARSARSALEAELERLRPVASCISAQPFGVFTVDEQNASVSFLPFARQVRLWRLDRVSFFEVEARLDFAFRPVGRQYEARHVGYSFAVAEAGGREIVTFHWHPFGISPVTAPHLHVSSRMPAIALGSPGTSLALSKVHIPTGQITLPVFVRFLIEELGGAPRRRNWGDILNEDGTDSIGTT